MQYIMMVLSELMFWCSFSACFFFISQNSFSKKNFLRWLQLCCKSGCVSWNPGFHFLTWALGHEIFVTVFCLLLFSGQVSLSTLLHLVKYYTPIPYLCPLLVSFVHHTLAKLGWASANYLTLPYLNLTIHRFAYTAKPSLRRSLRKSKFWNTKINLKKITTTAVKGRKFGGGEPIFEVVLFF